MNTTDIGRLGEAKIIAALVEQGWYPFTDLSGKCPVDIIAWKSGKTLTIQVKTTQTKSKSGKYVVQIGCIRPNRSGNVIKKFDGSAFDYLAIYVAPEDAVVFIQATSILTGRVLTLQNLEGSTLAC